MYRQIYYFLVKNIIYILNYVIGDKWMFVIFRTCWKLETSVFFHQKIPQCTVLDLFINSIWKFIRAGNQITTIQTVLMSLILYVWPILRPLMIEYNILHTSNLLSSNFANPQWHKNELSATLRRTSHVKRNVNTFSSGHKIIVFW